jgi:hypothetical protein
MGRGEKRLEEMRANPAGDWQIDDVGVVCRAFGIGLRAPRSGGSHCKVTHRSQHEILTIPARRPIKPVYIRRFVEFVDAVKEASGNGG